MIGGRRSIGGEPRGGSDTTTRRRLRRRAPLLEAEASRAEALEFGAIGARNVGIEYIRGCHQPGIVLAKTARVETLHVL